VSALRVLVVDDEPDFLQMIRVRLESEHYEVVTAAGGREAFELMKKFPPDAVLLDIMMPDMDGLEVLRKIRRSHKDLPVFMLTAFSDGKRFAAARKLNASGFVTKTDWMGEGMKNVTSALRLCARFKSR